jgi:hypothetical protein
LVESHFFTENYSSTLKLKFFPFVSLESQPFETMPPKAEKKPATATATGATAGKAPATEKRKAGRSEGGAKKKSRRKETFGSYIYKVLKQVMKRHRTEPFSLKVES